MVFPSCIILRDKSILSDVTAYRMPLKDVRFVPVREPVWAFQVDFITFYPYELRGNSRLQRCEDVRLSKTLAKTVPSGLSHELADFFT